MMAPAYTRTWIAPMKRASIITYNAARLNITDTSHSAAETGLLRVTNATADAIASKPKR